MSTQVLSIGFQSHEKNNGEKMKNKNWIIYLVYVASINVFASVYSNAQGLPSEQLNCSNDSQTKQ